MQIPQNLKEVIQARYDAKCLHYDAYFINPDYAMDFDSVDDFAHALPEQEGTSVFDEYEDPTFVTYLRFQAALLIEGYSNANLVHAVYKYHSTQSMQLLNILSSKSKDMFTFFCVYDGFDIRDIIVKAFLQVIKLLDFGAGYSFIQERMDEHGKLIPGDMAVSSFKRYIIKNGAKADKLSHFIDKMCKDLRETSANMFLDVTETINSMNRKYIDPYVKGDEYNMDLEPIYQPKMSSYMARFWNKHGDRFFDVKTRAKFLEELAEYRESIDELL